MKLRMVKITGILLATLFVLASCGLLARNPDSPQITITLPPVATSTRAIDRGEIENLHWQTRKYRVTFATEYRTVVHEGSDGLFSAYFAYGSTVSVMVECLNGSGQVILRTIPKTVKMTAARNSISFNLAEDGNKVEPQDVSGGSGQTSGNTPDAPATKYTVTYNLDGGEWSAGSISQVTQNYSEGETVTITSSEPTKQNKAFSGWKADTVSPSSGSNFDSGSAFTMPASNVTLTAQWRTTGYNVIYMSNPPAGSNVQSEQRTESRAVGQSFSWLSNPFTAPTGYTFANWNTKQDGTGTTLTGNATSEYTGKTSDITVYAKWTAKTYTIRYTNDKGQIPGTKDIKITDASVTHASEGTAAGYTFEGWFCDGENTSNWNAAQYIEHANSSNEILLEGKWQQTM